MPEIRECFIHFKHTHHVLVEQLHLGQNSDVNWALQGLFADATEGEAEISLVDGLTQKHCQGFVDEIGPSCQMARGHMASQTKIWPRAADSPGDPDDISDLVLEGLSYTPRSLILKFGRVDLQV